MTGYPSARRFLRTPLPLLLLLFACSSPAPEDGSQGESQQESQRESQQESQQESDLSGITLTSSDGSAIPASMQACASCHSRTVDEYLRHGMAQSVGPLGEPPVGTVDNPHSGNRYTLEVKAGESLLRTRFADGGERVHRLVGRIGAGRFDTSWVSMELDPFAPSGDSGTGRLFFAPVETITAHGHELSPFDIYPSQHPESGLHLKLTEGCLTCHTSTRLRDLPGAAVTEANAVNQGELAQGDAAEGYPAEDDPAHVFPGHLLGEDAFAHVEPFSCAACHGDPSTHVANMPSADREQVGLRRLSELTREQQIDVCARCHLQGDLRLDLVDGEVDPERPLAGQIAVVHSARPVEDFRFVGQVERLRLSACFQDSPEMSCTTCHKPHRSAEEQGTESFDASCQSCHQESCTRPADLTVEAVTGEPARSEAGCSDCHVRRSQPFDLPHIRSTDHWIRRSPPSAAVVPYRDVSDPGGPLTVAHDASLEEVLTTGDGARWRDGVLAMGYAHLGRFQEAAKLFEIFSPPGSGEALLSTAPPELTPLERVPAFHQYRARALLDSGDLDAARAALSDALRLDPLLPEALIERARLHFLAGDLPRALADTQLLIETYPRAEQPWNLRVAMAEQLRRPELIMEGLRASAQLRAADASVWYRLGLLQRQAGDPAAEESLARAKQLQPGLLADF